MSTPLSQKIGIWIIAIVLTVGTLGSFLAMVLSVQNQSIDQADQQKQYEKMLEDQKKQAQKNADNSESFSAEYSAAEFDASTVTALDVEVLVQGEGDVVKKTDSINASYFGWSSNGMIFDSSKKKDAKSDNPVTFALDGVIVGWTEGLSGIKVGSTVKLTIPAEKAYGAQGSGIITANSPLRFIVKIHKIDNTSQES